MAERGMILARTRTPPSDNFAELIGKVAAETGKSYWAQVREMYRLRFGPGRVSPIEYFYYGLYDDARTAAEKESFVGTDLRAEVNRVALDTEWFGLGKDKLAFYAAMAGNGLPVPETRAIYHAWRQFSDAEPLRGPEALGAYLRRKENYPFFSKPSGLMSSMGVAAVEAYDPTADEIRLTDGERFPVDQFVEEASYYFPKGYIFQELLRPHAAVEALIGARLSTVRVMVILGEDGPHILRATWRVPVGEGPADVYWRGNMMGAIDPETGNVERLVRGSGLTLEHCEKHPETGAPLLGCAFPAWEDMKAIVLAAAATLPGLPLQGWDVALTERGPVLVELEPDGGEPAVTQLASGNGLLDGPYGAHIERLLKEGEARARKEARGKKKRLTRAA